LQLLRQVLLLSAQKTPPLWGFLLSKVLKFLAVIAVYRIDAASFVFISRCNNGIEAMQLACNGVLLSSTEKTTTAIFHCFTIATQPL
jgi:hypothetical protein